MMIQDIKVKHLKDACQAVLIYGHEEKKRAGETSGGRDIRSFSIE